jgi:flavin reductase (DIM6/NTAB) family NADH-FMN oxidoreductase RutF
MNDKGVDQTTLRRTLARFATGVTVVTSVTTDGQRVGCTANSFCSVSLDPPLVLVCMAKGRFMHDVLRVAPGYAVNILASDQRHTAENFARPVPDRFAGVAVRPGRLGIPLLEGAVAHVQCELHEIHDAGDHSIVVGRVVEAATAEGAPLIFAHGIFATIGAEA